MKPHTPHTAGHTLEHHTAWSGCVPGSVYPCSAEGKPVASRFDQPDKKSGDYKWLSPYIFCAADPINFSDPTGMRIIAAEPGGPFYEWREVDGQWAFYDHGNVAYSGNDSFMLTLTEALTSISSCKEGMRLVSSIVNNENVAIIKQGDKSQYDDSNFTVEWNTSGIRKDGTNEGVPVNRDKIDNNPIINLAHELAHVEYGWGGYDNSEWYKEIDDLGFLRRPIKRSEIYTTFHENLIRKQFGSPLRTYYSKDSNGSRHGQILENGASLYFDINGNIHYKKIKDKILRYRF